MYPDSAERKVERIKKGLDQHEKELKQDFKTVGRLIDKKAKTREQLLSLRVGVIKLIEREEAWRGWMLDANKILSNLPNPLFAETVDLANYVRDETVDAVKRIAMLRQVVQNIDADLVGAGSRIRGPQ